VKRQTSGPSVGGKQKKKVSDTDQEGQRRRKKERHNRFINKRNERKRGIEETTSKKRCRDYLVKIRRGKGEMSRLYILIRINCRTVGKKKKITEQIGLKTSSHRTRMKKR